MPAGRSDNGSHIMRVAIAEATHISTDEDLTVLIISGHALALPPPTIFANMRQPTVSLLRSTGCCGCDSDCRHIAMFISCSVLRRCCSAISRGAATTLNPPMTAASAAMTRTTFFMIDSFLSCAALLAASADRHYEAAPKRRP